MGWVEKTNLAVAKSVVGRRFRLEFSGHKYERKGSRFLTEIRAGLATFFAMAYIVGVNASIVSLCGGTCVCRSPTDHGCFDVSDPRYLHCQQEVKQDLVTATAAIACLTSVAMGLFANLPISLAPGMGVNVYFTFQVVGIDGTGPVSYRMTLTIIFAEGLIFVAMTMLGLRQWLAKVIPASLKIACGAGIGLYLSIIGLTYNAGIGAITGSTSEPVQLGGCVQNLRDDNGMCTSGQMRNPTMWLGILGGGMFTALLMMYRVRGALIFGILLVSIISWPRKTPFTYFPNTISGDQSFDFFKKIIAFSPMKHILLAQDWHVELSQAGQFIATLLTFLYVDILDCTGTLYSMARFCGAVDEVTQDFENSTIAYLTDASGISIGSLFGVTPVTAFIESGAGISEGGATGLTAITTGICFFISIFFAPIFASIPPWATGCTLILVGAMMARAVVDINWRYMGDSVPAFLTLAVMPFTFSIAYGLITGIVTYTFLNGLAWIISKISRGRVVPHDHDHADYWSPQMRDGLLPEWLKRLAKGKRAFWRDWSSNEAQTQLGSHDSYGQTMQWHRPAIVELPMVSTTDFVRTWEMPQLSPTKSSVSASPIEFSSDRRRLERFQQMG